VRTGSAIPTKIADLDRKRDAFKAVRTQIDELEAVVKKGLIALPLADAEALLRRMADDGVTPLQQARIVQIEQELTRIGVGALLDEIRSDRAPAALWDDRLWFAWLRSCLDALQVEEPELASFKGNTHQRIVDEFKQLDIERLQLAVSRVRRAHAENVIRVRNAHPEQDALVKREAAKKRRHLPLRKVFHDASDVMTALHPCWMASPLSVSQLLPGDRQYFDIVIFDEASQVLPEDAVTSLCRGHRAVVAGDRRQLPPTTFFAAGTEEEGDEESATGGFESLLDVMSSFLDPPWGLDWHYRSRDESLIAFSNHHVYGNRLVTFPGGGGEPVISHVLLPHVPGPSGEETSSAEVERVVQLVLEHAENRPHETLGVIAMGLPHALRVEAAVDRAMQERPELAEFFDTQKPERFFVKNLERVQGDEREAIILTVGYGKDASGRLPYRFGPLLYEGGERRLNVAVTRARSRMAVVSSFSHFDMDPGRSSSKGVALLRSYLEYAANGGRRQTSIEATGVPLNDFEQAVSDALTARGYKLLPQWGASRYRIDLVAQHPERPGRFVLAVECDGATYHSSYTARDRDRLRQQHLEALGWRFHRIWSTDWFLNRESEIERFEKAFFAAVAAADAWDAGHQERHTTSLPHEAPGVATASSVRSKPNVPKRGSIDEYSEREIDRVVGWILSKSLKTDEEIIAEAVRELGFQRRGARIDAAIRESINRVRAR
jgi:very-short-patch-repair endonuclease